MTTQIGRARPWVARQALAAVAALLLMLMPGVPVWADATVPAPDAGMQGAGITADESGAILRP